MSMVRHACNPSVRLTVQPLSGVTVCICTGDISGSMSNLMHVLRKSFEDVAEKEASIGANFALAAWQSTTNFCTSQWMTHATQEMHEWIKSLASDGGTDMRCESLTLQVSEACSVVLDSKLDHIPVQASHRAWHGSISRCHRRVGNE
jgi:hypothetical protein